MCWIGYWRQNSLAGHVCATSAFPSLVEANYSGAYSGMRRNAIGPRRTAFQDILPFRRAGGIGAGPPPGAYESRKLPYPAGKPRKQGSGQDVERATSVLRLKFVVDIGRGSLGFLRRSSSIRTGAGCGSTGRSRRGRRPRGLGQTCGRRAAASGGEVGEPAFDLVDPGRTGRGEVNVEPGMPRDPLVDGGRLVGYVGRSPLTRASKLWRSRLVTTKCAYVSSSTRPRT
jgi:hypothetical protein